MRCTKDRSLLWGRGSGAPYVGQQGGLKGTGTAALCIRHTSWLWGRQERIEIERLILTGLVTSHTASSLVVCSPALLLPPSKLLLQPSLGASTDVQLPFAYDKGESIGIQCLGSGYPPHHQISKSICVRCLPLCQLSNTYWSVMNKGLESCEGKGAVRVKEKQCVSFKLD